MNGLAADLVTALAHVVNTARRGTGNGKAELTGEGSRPMKYLLREERGSRCPKVDDGGVELFRPWNIAWDISA